METQPTNAAAPEALDARGRAEAVDGEGGARDIKRSLEARASRLPLDVWRGVAALCSVESMLTLETAGKELRNLLRGRSMDAVWRHRFGKAEPALATVLVEGTGRDLCRMYHERCRVRWVHSSRSQQRGILGVGGWHGQPEHPLDRPRVILVVYDFAAEFTWGGTDGLDEEREDELVWVAPPGLSNEWDRDTLDSGMISCFLVNQQNMVELWRNMSGEVTVSNYEREALQSFIDTVNIFAFHEQTVPPMGQVDLDRLSRLRHGGARGAPYDMKSFGTLLSLDCDLLFTKSEVSGRYRLLDACLSPDFYNQAFERNDPLRNQSSEARMNTLSSMLSCVLNSPAEGRAHAAGAAPPPPAGLD